MILLCGAGAGQEVGLLAGHPELGIFLVVPAMVACYALWRPRGAVLAILLGLLAVQALVPIHTGGGRVQDWILHFEVSRHYAGLDSPVTPTFLSSRTALFHQLLGAILAHVPAYWAYQVGSALLNGLWLWPASLLVQRLDRSPVRIAAVALTPLLLAYSTYTWPWCFAAFFLLTAVLLAESDDRLGSLAVGVALAAALLAHPGSIGYVAGVGAWIAVRRPRRLPITALAGAAILATQVPWLLAITGGRGVVQLLASTDTLRQRVGPVVWLVTRILVAVHSVVPFAALSARTPWADLLLVFFIASLPGAALLAWLTAGRSMWPRGAARWAVVGGFVVGWAIDPPQQALAGMLDALFLGVLLLLVNAAAEAPAPAVGRMFSAHAVAAGVFVLALLSVAVTAGAGDANIDYKQHYGAVFLVERFGILPAILLVGAAGLATLWPRWSGRGRSPSRAAA
ncbi:MAG TPA: hypothetical protein VIN56_11465 [Candidatus Dormibacteraeota bacterium]|jgi:hypothetical protein